MKTLNIKKTELSPKIVLNKEEGIFLFAGKSIIENAEEFYSAVHNWFKEYFKKPNPETDIIFFFEYFNSISSHQVGNLIEFLSKQKNTKLNIYWLFENGDDLMEDSGKEFQLFYDIKLNFVELNKK